MAPRKKVNSEEPTILPVEEKKLQQPVKTAKKNASVAKAEAKKAVKTEKKPEQIISSPEISVMAEPEPKAQAPVNPSHSNREALILGGGLLLMGIILLVGRILSIPFGDYMWPFIFIVPGVLVFMSALVSESSSGEGLSILGAILTTLGLIFLFQSITGLWASWAYIWALVAPASIGAAQMIYGSRKNRESIVQSGRKLVNLGLIFFAIGFVFFEVIIGISGFGIGNFGLPVVPVMMVFIGAVILVRALIKNR